MSAGTAGFASPVSIDIQALLYFLITDVYYIRLSNSLSVPTRRETNKD